MTASKIKLRQYSSMQGSNYQPKTFISATVIILALLFSMVVFNAYITKLTSELAIQLQEIHSAEELFYDTDFSLGYVADSGDELYLKHSNDSFMKKIYEKASKGKNGIVQELRHGLMRALKSKKYAIFSQQKAARNTIEKMSVDEKCAVCYIVENSESNARCTIV